MVVSKLGSAVRLQTYFQKRVLEVLLSVVFWNSFGAKPPGPRNYTAKMSLCVVSAGNSLATIEARSDWIGNEPVYGSGTDQSSMDAILTQLSDDSNLAARGVMNLTAYTIGEYKNYTRAIQNIRGGYGAYLTNDPQPDDVYDDSLRLEQLETLYWSMFREHLTDPESSVAFGLQSILTLMCAQVFYNWFATIELVPVEGSDSNGTHGLDQEWQYTDFITQSAILVQVPTKKTGLHIALCIVGLHFVCVVIIFWLYFTCKADKFLDQAWRTIGQVHSGEAKRFLDVTGNRNDVEVASLRAAKVNWRRIVTISKTSGIILKMPSM